MLEEETRLLVSGLCGRIWTLARDYPALAGADAFRDWSEPGTVRVLFAHWIEPAGRMARAELVSEARVQPLDRAAALTAARPVGGGGPLRAARGLGGAQAACGQAEADAPSRGGSPAQDPPAANARR